MVGRLTRAMPSVCRSPANSQMPIAVPSETDVAVSFRAELLAPPASCGGGGAPSRCGGAGGGADGGLGAACTPKTCLDQGIGCGLSGDGCGNTIDCGGCPSGQSCGANGQASRCANSGCAPRSPVSGLRRQVWSGRRWLRWPADCGGCGTGESCGAGGFRASAVLRRVPVFGWRRGVVRGEILCRAVAECGLAGDGCGNQIDCGACGSGACGGGGVPSHCGNTQSCVPTQSSTLCAGRCGKMADGCGGVVDCDVCAPGQIPVRTRCPMCAGHRRALGATLSIGRPCARGLSGSWQTGAAARTTAVDAKPPQTCGGGGAPSHCGGTAGCTPLLASAVCSGKCGKLADGCGGVVDCAGCPSGEACGVSVANVCGSVPTSTCTPVAQATACASKCGPIADGCGGIYDCGGCVAPATCGGGGVASQCGGTAQCVRRQCSDVSANCGPLADGCGGLVNCGVCAGNQTCGGGGVPNVCGGVSSCTPTCSRGRVRNGQLRSRR